MCTLPLLLTLNPAVAFATEPTASSPGPSLAQPLPAAPDDRVVVTDPDIDAPQPFNAFYHGFRLGYTYINGVGPGSRLASPHLFVVGYEATRRIQGGDWLNVIVVGNASVAGLNQSLFLPSLNLLVGFELAGQIQIGTGVNLAPFDPDRRFAHQIIAVGWTPKAGAFNVPIHFTVIPDVAGHWRVGSTVGVNW